MTYQVTGCRLHVSATLRSRERGNKGQGPSAQGLWMLCLRHGCIRVTLRVSKKSTDCVGSKRGFPSPGHPELVEPAGRRRRDLGGRTDRKDCEFARLVLCLRVPSSASFLGTFPQGKTLCTVHFITDIYIIPCRRHTVFILSSFLFII